MTAYKTAQESFWAGDFGNDYIGRNAGASLLAANLAFFTKALDRCPRPRSCIEFGANIGMNLKALQLLYPQIDASAVEINARAAAELRAILPSGNVHETSILEFRPTRSYDLAFIKGVLIHINPDALPGVYDLLHQAAGRYLLVAEYYNPAPVAIPYRGHSDRLFKRDFAGEIMDRHKDLALVDYGFAYRRDPSFPQDDITWFLMEKRPA
ncbi:MAG: pseudaminic acid biosynthesis-associated methylase [Hyphomicrobiaceae bacterium]